MKKVLIIYSHPANYKSHINAEMIKAISPLHGVTIHDLYNEYPDFHIDIIREQELLTEHDIVVWQHPFYWYSSPSLLKEWIDLVFEHNFAFGKKGKALQGKIVFNAITLGGSKTAYSTEGINRYPLSSYLLPFEQTAKLSGMIYLPPFSVYKTHELSQAKIFEISKFYRDLIEHLRDTLFDESIMTQYEYLNDYIQELIRT